LPNQAGPILEIAKLAQTSETQVREGKTDAWGGHLMPALFRKILVPHDFSRHATRALRVAAHLAAVHKGRLVVLHALPPVYPVVGLPPLALRKSFPPPAEGPALVRRVRQRLEALVARELSGQRRQRVECRVVVADAFQAIMEAAGGATVIVMGTLGRTGLPRLLIGSVAQKTVQHSPVPVLTIRAPVVRARAARRRRGARRRRAAA
jgi:nucleotide-binding universal stress UspA family protein